MTLSKYDRENVGRILADPSKDWFTAQLLRLIVKADQHHRALLAQGFPEEVRLVENHLGLALTTDRARAEPEESICTTACDQPTEAHCTDLCPCYQAGANEGHSSGCNDDSCACWAAGHEAGLEAQRERVG